MFERFRVFISLKKNCVISFKKTANIHLSLHNENLLFQNENPSTLLSFSSLHSHANKRLRERNLFKSPIRFNEEVMISNFLKLKLDLVILRACFMDLRLWFVEILNIFDICV